MEFLPLVGIALLFWLFIIRPASRRQKELGRMQSSLSQGDEVVLTSGIYGTIQRLEDDHIAIEVAEGVVIKVARGAIGSKVERPTETEELTEAQTDNAGSDKAGPGTDPEEN